MTDIWKYIANSPLIDLSYVPVLESLEKGVVACLVDSKSFQIKFIAKLRQDVVAQSPTDPLIYLFLVNVFTG